MYQHLKLKVMKTNYEQVKAKVIVRLLNAGNNEKDIQLMIKRHFDYAFEHYNSVKSIAEAIRAIY